MSLSGVRLGFRIGAGVVGVLAVAYVASAVQTGAQNDSGLDGGAVMRGVVLLMLAVGFWGIVEVVAGGFEEIADRTRERYDHLEATQASAYAIAAQVLLLANGKAAEDCPNVSVLRR